MDKMPKWIRERVEDADLPPKAYKPWYMPRRIVTRRFLLEMGSKAVYRLWQSSKNYGVVEHFILIQSPEELDKLSDYIRYDQPLWSCHFLWFYEYPSLEEWTDIVREVEKLEKERI